MRTIRLPAILALTAFLALPSMSASNPPVDQNIYNYLQLLRSDFNSTKVKLVNEIMKLSAAALS